MANALAGMRAGRLGTQRGMTGIGWLMVLALIAFFALVVLRLAPAYLEYAKVASVLEGMGEVPLITKKPNPEVRGLIRKRFSIEDVHSMKVEDIEIGRKAGVLTLRAAYEVRSPLIGNVDVVVSFDKQVEVIAN